MRATLLPGCYSRHTVILPEAEFRYAFVSIPAAGRREHVRYQSRTVIGLPDWTVITYHGASCSGTFRADKLGLEPARPFTPEEHLAADEHLERIKPIDWW